MKSFSRRIAAAASAAKGASDSVLIAFFARFVYDVKKPPTRSTAATFSASSRLALAGGRRGLVAGDRDARHGRPRQPSNCGDTAAFQRHETH
jgi:hypothetical protein